MTETPITWNQVSWLVAHGVPRSMAGELAGLRAVDEELAFFEEIDEDLILWNPRTREISTWAGRAFALGATDNLSAASGALHHLHLYADPLDWLIARGRGLVVVDWLQAFDRLRDVPRIAVDERLVDTYRKSMLPQVPDLSVITSDQRMTA